MTTNPSKSPRVAPAACVLASALTLAAAASALRGENWPNWRGPRYDGSSAETGLPETFSPTENVLWKVRLPGWSMSTPVVWGDRVFLSCADQRRGNVLAMCFSGTDGKLLWSEPAGRDRKFMGGLHNAASPSPVTDGKTVWFLYGNGGLHAFDMDGNHLWARQLEEDYGRFIIKWGFASSPLLYEGKLFIPVLQNVKPGRYDKKKSPGVAADTRKGPLESFLLGLDAGTGKTVWRHVRKVPADVKDESTESYATMTPFEGDGRKEIVILGGEHVTSHDPATGEEIWRWQFTPHERKVWQRTVAPVTPGEDRVFFPRSRWQWTYGLKPAGRTGTLPPDAAWKQDTAPGDVAAPLLYKGRLYLLSGKHKSLTCMEPATGKVIWSGRLGSDFRASPTGADGKIYCIGMTGKVYVVAAGDEFKLLSEIDMAEKRTKRCYSTIVPANGRLYVRMPEMLYCIGRK